MENPLSSVRAQEESGEWRVVAEGSEKKLVEYFDVFFGKKDAKPAGATSVLVLPFTSLERL